MDNELLEVWKKWKGEVDCIYSNKLYSAIELREICEYLKGELSNSGVCASDTVAMVLPNTVAFPVVLMALLSLGCNPIMLHYSSKLNDVINIAKEIPIKFFIHDFHKELSYINMDDVDMISTFQIGAVKAYLCKFENADDRNKIGQEGTILHLTSGTYGKPLICYRNQKSAIAEAVNYATAITEFSRIKIAVTTPLSHAFAYGFGLMTALITDSVLVIDSEFNPKRLVRYLNEKQCDILTVVPPMIKNLLDISRNKKINYFPKVVFYAGQSCNQVMEEVFENTFQTTLYSIYGSTETGAIATNYSQTQKLANLGCVLKGVSVKIESQSEFENLGKSTGYVYVKATSMMQGYYGNEEKEIDFFSTGDIGNIEQGIISLVGRARGIINKSGYKIDPTEVENILLQFNGISDASVYGSKSENNNEMVAASIVCEKEINLQELRNYCKDTMNIYKIPSRFFQVNQIPRTSSGKPLKYKLPGFSNVDSNI